MSAMKKINDDCNNQGDANFNNEISKLVAKLLKENIPMNNIIDITGCSLDEILKIKNSIL